uniref:Uncharacterized protein n=1 Tax=uncultured delta proteobacterium DeepAnt-32C6 TaxID=357895 RepID=Q2I6K7_9DELT|nr:Hypothetical protein [uncultured delta proteobacterium DeepAnt-32C6]
MHMTTPFGRGVVCFVALVVGACADAGTTTPAPADAAVASEITTAEDAPVEPSPDTVAEVQVNDAGPGDMMAPALAPEEVFAFGLDPAQTMSAAPFPNNLYRDAAGAITLAPLEDDPVLKSLVKAEVLARWTAVAPTRTGFAHTAGVFFFMAEDPDVESFRDRARLVCLEGPEAGRELAVDVFAAAHAPALGVRVAWGEYMLPDSTYAVLIGAGGKTSSGVEPTAPASFEAVLATNPPAEVDAMILAARQVYAPLRVWMVTAEVDPGDQVVATIFTTDAVLPLGQKLMAAVDGFALQPITARVAWDYDGQEYEVVGAIEGEALESFFGTPLAPFEHNPGHWGSSRYNAERLEGYGQVYEGGTLHKHIGRVVSGSIIVPAFNHAVEDGSLINTGFRYAQDGSVTHSLNAMVPFSLFLCDTHLSDLSEVPVAIFSHGGGATRGDAVAFANVNCLSGVATIAIDMLFHGGRTSIVKHPDELLVLPMAPDTSNHFTGLSEGEEGFVRDYIGDSQGAALSVGQMFAASVAPGFEPDALEANALTVSADTYTLVRYLEEGDWSAVQPGLSFDPGKLFHQSLSFGASFTTPLIALADNFRGVVTSVGAGSMVVNTLPMSPTNAMQASVILRVTLGLSSSTPELSRGSHRDIGLNLLQWLTQRGDPGSWASYVLRQRPSGAVMSVLGSGTSWDETLHSGAELSFANAYGLPAYTDGGAWQLGEDVPGAELVTLTSAGAREAIVANVTYGDTTHTAASFYLAQSCHAHAVAALCRNSFEHPYPPVTSLDPYVVFDSPICAYQHQVRHFIDSLLDDAQAIGIIIPPAGSCADLYGN